MEQALYDRPDAYDALYASKDYEREVRFVLNRFNEHGNSGDRVLVVGCGTGQHSLFLRERGFEVTGVDPNPTRVSIPTTRRSISCGSLTPCSTISQPTNWSRRFDRSPTAS
ncbi:hypothetical protein BRC68_01330 [Halobacteriales archaeon QH_6_64_20]|nr:MAG: hypothetical protein BRC68_01330 [Halobacteriales archaeon QH_6_64_20]